MSWRWPTAADVLRVVEPRLFGHRRAGLAFLIALTAFFGWHALQVELDAGFDKQIPLEHPYMQTFVEHREAFGGANLISVALMQREGNIYNEAFLDKLDRLTEAVFFLPGVDRSRVSSLFTPGVRYIEITEDGIASGDVVPRNYAPSPEMFTRIRANVGKAGIVGRLVAENHGGAMVVAELLEHDPTTGEKLDYREVEDRLEQIRAQFEDAQTRVHIIGFAMVVGKVADAATEVVAFFALALALTALLLRVYCASWRLSLLPLLCALVAVVWEFGLLRLAGFGLDPFAILVPFLVLANGVEHGIQMVNAWADEVTAEGKDAYNAAIGSFRRVAIPGTAALVTDVIGFATIALINIQIIQEMAINAAFGMAAIIVTNKWLMPILLSWLHLPDRQRYAAKLAWREEVGDKAWVVLARATGPRAAPLLLLGGAVLFGLALYKGQDLRIGDFHEGVPELRPDSRYNRDSAAIVDNFAIGVDVLKVFIEAPPQACTQSAVLHTMDRLAWHLRNTPGVDSVLALPRLAKAIRVGWNEGSPLWYALPRNRYALVQTISPIPSSAGLQNPDCSVMPMLVFTTDHRAETIDAITRTVEDFRALYAAEQAEQGVAEPPLNIALAGGNVGVMAATNAVIRAEEKPVLLWVYAAVGLMCWLSFRSIGSLACVMTPLAIVSFAAYALMAWLEIGLKVATLPVTALAVGIGIDFGIYSYSVLEGHLRAGLALPQAWLRTLQQTGKAVVFTGLALSAGVVTWMLSDLQFQRDMGVLLTFMFLANMLGAILLLPALARYVLRHEQACRAAEAAP